jgi:PAS domain S-box-containing protein
MKISDVRKWKALWVQGGLLSLAAALSLALLIPLWLEVTGKLEQMQVARRDSVVWTITQLEVEFMELEKAALRLEYTGAAALPDLTRRFNVFYSRIKTLMQSPLYRRAIREAQELDRLERVQSKLDALVPLIDGPPQALLAQRQDLRKRIEALHGDTRRIVTNGNFVLTANTEEARQVAAHLVQRLGLIALMLFGSLFGLAFMFSRLYLIHKRRARENLLTTQRLITVIETSPDAIVVTNTDGVILDFNTAAAQLLGYLPEQARGLDLSVMLQQETGAPAALPMASRSVFRKRMNGRMQSGQPLPLEVSQGATSMGERPIYVYFLRDISDRLAAEEALQSSLDKAVAGERAKAHFLAVMSHEMRTPLNGILGVVELLRSRIVDAKNRHYLSLLERSGKVLLDHVNEVLDLTEIEARGVSLKEAPFDMDRLLRDVVASMRPAAAARGNTLTLTAVPVKLGWFNGDIMRMQQVLVNLLSNAVKFTDNGQIELLISAEPTKAGTQLEIQVIDTGIGIAAESQEKVFDDFVRDRSDWEGQIEGSGLGLGIVRRIISVMQGEIGVESVQGEGSLFWVRLTLPPVEPKGLSEPEQPIQAESAPAFMEILIVEDNATNRFVLREMLEQDGHVVIEAENGQIGVDQARNRPFDVILMDINMPVMGGVEATRQIRTSSKNTKTRIVALTAHVLDQDARLYHEVGLDAVVAKPINRSSLRAILSGQGHVTEAPHDNQNLDRSVLNQLSEKLTDDRLHLFLEGTIAEGDAFIDRLPDMPHLARDEIIRQVHTLSGTAAMIGATRLRSTLTRLETKLREAHNIDFRVWLETLRVLWVDTRVELVEYADTIGVDAGA